jgi:hypothetical protein
MAIPAHPARLVTMLAALGLCVSGAGCTAVSTGASVVSLMATKKTITDHVVSFATGEDCSIVAYERGDPYCVDPNVVPTTPVYHCYRTLGQIDCYETEDPFRNGHLAVQ